jgi:hypothetical protein
MRVFNGSHWAELFFLLLFHVLFLFPFLLLFLVCRPQVATPIANPASTKKQECARKLERFRKFPKAKTAHNAGGSMAKSLIIIAIGRVKMARIQSSIGIQNTFVRGDCKEFRAALGPTPFAAPTVAVEKALPATEIIKLLLKSKLSS